VGVDKVSAVVAIADHRRAHRALALGERGVDVLAQVDTCEAADRAVRERHPDIALIDVGLPGNVFATIASIARRRPPVAVIAMGDTEDRGDFLAAVASGAVGYLAPSVTDDALARAVSGAARGEAAFPRRMVRILTESLQKSPLNLGGALGLAAPKLTEREWEVLRFLWQGRSTAEIASALFVSEGTVRSHVSLLVHKLGLHDRTDLLELVPHGPGKHSKHGTG
jgi:DNA-binding NarL/FixJ family response regulator